MGCPAGLKEPWVWLSDEWLFEAGCTLLCVYGTNPREALEGLKQKIER